MVNYLVQNRWLVALRGVLAIIFGILAFIWPGGTAVALVYLFAAYAILDGILEFASVVRHKEAGGHRWLTLLEGIVDIAAGVIAFLFPTLAAFVLLFVIAAWAIITGVLEIITAIRLRREITNEWALGLAGVVSIILGVILFLNPGAGIIGVVWAIGGYAIIFGILMLVLAVRAGRFTGTGTTTPSGGTRIYP